MRRSWTHERIFASNILTIISEVGLGFDVFAQMDRPSTKNKEFMFFRIKMEWDAERATEMLNGRIIGDIKFKCKCKV